LLFALFFALLCFTLLYNNHTMKVVRFDVLKHVYEEKCLLSVAQ
jgi:hypothetical protein